MSETGRSIDTAELESSLSAVLDADVVEIEELHDGLNLSLAVSTAETERAYVVRRPNELRHTESFNDLQQEYGVLERLQKTAITAPEPILVCDDESLVGDPFLVTTYLDGTAVQLGSRLPERFRTADARSHVGAHLIDVLADLHSVDVEPFAGICERITPTEQVERDIDRLDDATSVTGHEPPGLWTVAEWLQRHVPSEPTTTLAHGDFRPGNVLLGGTDSPEITGVLDWETAFLGDPLTEVGYLLLRWRDDGDPTPSLDGIETRHSDADVLRDLRETNEHGLAPFTSHPGSPSRRELVARYETETGTGFENERVYRALAAFMLAAVWADLHRLRVERGAESDWEPYIEYMSLVATSIVEGEFEL